MSTSKDTVDFILSKLRHADRFSTRAMFGEYALYADGTVVALICDDRLYVKITPQSAALGDICEQGEPYPGAKLYYLVEEYQLTQLSELPHILFQVAESCRRKRKERND